MTERTYSRDEMEAILKEAIGSSATAGASSDDVRHDELLAAAREVGIDPRTIERAIERVEGERAIERVEGERALRAKESDEAAIVQRAHDERKSSARHAIVSFAILSAFLAAIDWLTPGQPWAQWPILVFVFLSAMRFVRAARPFTSQERERVLRREERRRAKEARREARGQAARAFTERLSQERAALQRADAERRARNEKWRSQGEELGRVVEERVSQLVGELTSRLREANRAEGAPSGEFGDFVRRERARAAGLEPTRGPGGRVEAPAPEARAAGSFADRDEDEDEHDEDEHEDEHEDAVRRAPRRGTTRR